MKKIVKNGLIAILVVLMTLCLVSCGGNEAGGNPAGGGSGSGSGGGYPILDTDFDIDSDGSGFDFEVIYQNGLIAGLVGDASDDRLAIIFTFMSAESTITADYFDKVTIQGAQTDITNPQYASGMLYFSIVATEAGGLGEYLPSASTWYVDFSSESNPSRNMTLTVPSQYVTQIKEFINGWEPSPAGE